MLWFNNNTPFIKSKHGYVMEPKEKNLNGLIFVLSVMMMNGAIRGPPLDIGGGGGGAGVFA